MARISEITLRYNTLLLLPLPCSLSIYPPAFLCLISLQHVDHQRFFEAHRLLARKTVKHGPGFWIRFTVHYNLFAGTILAVGSDEQVDDLAAYQAEGKLGCFSLTEKLAGVLSGFIVDTTATYDRDIDGFVINSPTTGSKKNWISQGFTADKTVVLADLRVGGESKGPHAFVMDFRAPPDNAAGEAIGQLVPGISCHDMGKKTGKVIYLCLYPGPESNPT